MLLELNLWCFEMKNDSKLIKLLKNLESIVMNAAPNIDDVK